MHKLLTLFFTLLFAGAIHAQHHKCATPPGKSHWLINYQRSPGTYPRSANVLYVPLTVHLVGSSAGNGFFSTRQLLDAFCTLQNDFVDSDIQFFIEGDINYIANSAYNNHDFGTGFLMMEENNVPNTINCYIVSDPAGACGYYSPSADGVALNKSCAGPNDHTWAHEIGHFLTLPHPFLGWEGIDYSYGEETPETVGGWGTQLVEKVDGTNCQVAADGFCDTPPDYLSDRWPCNEENLSSQLQKDQNGEEFRSDGTLFMGYAFDDCSSRFSEEQIAAMRANLLTERASFLYNQEPPLVLDGATAELISPSGGEVLDEVTQVTLVWEPVPNATGYLVDFDMLLFNGSGFNFANFETTETSITIDGLVSERDYRWSVRAFNNNDGCADYAEFATFSINTFINSTQEVPGLQSWEVYPQPVNRGQRLQLAWQMLAPVSLQLKVLNLSGQVMHTELLPAQSGPTHYELATSQLPAGVYVIALESEQGVSHRRVVVQ